MRIVLVGPVYPYRGGIAHYTTVLYEALIEAGHHVLLISFRRQYPAWMFPGRSDKDTSVAVLQVDSAEYLIDSLNPLTWLLTLRRIAQFDPDKVVLQWWTAFWAPAWFTLGLANRLLLRRRLMYICHNVLSHEKRRWDALIARLTLGWADEWIVASESEKAVVSSLLPSAKTQVVPHPVYRLFTDLAMSREKARDRLNLPEDELLLLFFGIVRPYKGLRHLLLALPSLQASLGSVHLVVAGEFWEPKQLYLDLINRLGIASNVTIDDRYIPNEELPLYFSAADMLVAPYLRVTGSGAVQMAQGYNLPVVVTWKEMLSTPYAVAAPEDVDSLVAAILELAGRLSDSDVPATDVPTSYVNTWERLVSAIEGRAA